MSRNPSSKKLQRIEKAAREIARKTIPISWYLPSIKNHEIFEMEARLEKKIVRLVDREVSRALKEWKRWHNDGY
jgi:hypothetical protein